MLTLEEARTTLNALRQLAQEIQRGVQGFIAERSRPPKIILMENHGLIALGKTPNAVIAGTLMAEKAAQVFIGAAALGVAALPNRNM